VSDSQYWLIIASTLAQSFALVLGMLAVQDVVTNGMVVKNVPFWAKVLLFFILISQGVSALAGIYRVHDESWSMIFREWTKIANALAWCIGFILILATDTLESDGKKVNGYYRFLRRLKVLHQLPE